MFVYPVMIALILLWPRGMPQGSASLVGLRTVAIVGLHRSGNPVPHLQLVRSSANFSRPLARL